MQDPVQNQSKPLGSTDQSSPPFTSSEGPQAGSFNESPNPVTVTVAEEKGRGGFRIFVIIGVVVIVGVWGFVGYLYLNNQSIRSSRQEKLSQATQNPTLTPTPAFSPEQVKIQNGSVVREIPGVETKVLVNKEEFTSTGITGFARVVVSPDNLRICFESWPPAPEPSLYLANVDGSQVIEVSPNRQNCMWMADSKKILYVNSSSQVQASNIYLYTLETAIEENLTSPSVPAKTTRRFQLVGLSADGSKAICSYEDVGDLTSTGQCEIEISTKEVTYPQSSSPVSPTP